MSLLNPAEQKAAEEAQSSQVVPAGIYTCRVFGVERWSNGTSLVWKFKVAKGQPLAGKEFWDWTGLGDKGIWKTKAHIMNLGFPLTAGEDEMVGTPCKVFVEVGTNKDTGDPKNVVKKVIRFDGELPDEDPPRSMDDDLDDAFGPSPGATASEDDLL